MSQILGHPRWPTTPLAFCAGRQPARKWKKAERSTLTQRDKPSTEIRNSVRVLKAQGQTLREISRLLKLSRNAVRRILREREVAGVPPCPAPTLAKLDDAFARAGGNVTRVQQLVAPETDLRVAYSTLTRLIREAGPRQPPPRAGGDFF